MLKLSLEKQTIYLEYDWIIKLIWVLYFKIIEKNSL